MIPLIPPTGTVSTLLPSSQATATKAVSTAPPLDPSVYAPVETPQALTPVDAVEISAEAQDLFEQLSASETAGTKTETATLETTSAESSVLPEGVTAESHEVPGTPDLDPPPHSN